MGLDTAGYVALSMAPGLMNDQREASVDNTTFCAASSGYASAVTCRIPRGTVAMI